MVVVVVIVVIVVFRPDSYQVDAVEHGDDVLVEEGVQGVDGSSLHASPEGLQQFILAGVVPRLKRAVLEYVP